MEIKQKLIKSQKQLTEIKIIRKSKKIQILYK